MTRPTVKEFLEVRLAKVQGELLGNDRTVEELKAKRPGLVTHLGDLQDALQILKQQSEGEYHPPIATVDR